MHDCNETGQYEHKSTTVWKRNVWTSLSDVVHSFKKYTSKDAAVDLNLFPTLSDNRGVVHSRN